MFKGKSSRRALESLKLVHSNVSEPINLASKAENKNIITFIND